MSASVDESDHSFRFNFPGEIGTRRRQYFLSFIPSLHWAPFPTPPYKLICLLKASENDS